MKVFLKWFSIPLFITFIACILYIVDALVGGIFIKNTSFMWVGFFIWTLFNNASIKDRIKGLISIVIGFLATIIMMYITNSFDLNFYKISISSLLGIFLINFIVMFVDNADKRLPISITGIFTGISLTFSGLGVNLNPLENFKSFFLMFAIILVYSIIGMVCSFLSLQGTTKIKNHINELNNNPNK